MNNSLLLKQTLYFENNRFIDLSNLSKFAYDKNLINDLLNLDQGENTNFKYLHDFEYIRNLLINRGIFFPRRSNEGDTILTAKIDTSIEKGIRFLHDSQTHDGNFGIKGFFDIWETANALLAIYNHSNLSNSDMIENGLNFLKKYQHENGRFHWGSINNKLFCTETTALCGLVFNLYGLEENAEKTWKFLKTIKSWSQVFEKHGNKLFHKFPSILGYILNFAVYHDEKFVENNLEYFQNKRKEVGSWGVHASYFQSEFYAIKEIIPILNKYHIKNNKTEDFLTLYQNFDGGYGFSTNPLKSDVLPTSMALRSIDINNIDTPLKKMVNKGVNWLMNSQNYNGGWTSQDSQMYAVIPDEYTEMIMMTKKVRIFNKLNLLKYLLNNEKTVMLKEYPSKLFYLQRVSDYSTSVFTTSQALIALSNFKLQK